jgi:rhodanese-related sulfurtransferase
MSTPELPLEIDIAGVSSLQASQEEFLFLDCREQTEYDTAHIPGTTLIPMSELQDRVAELHAARNQRVVVHCHHGGRSLRVARWLRSQGFDQAQSLAGGIDAWSQQVDPGIPRY